ncbi:MAG: lipid-A-disaccharide synthase [Oceanococcaceae bacterium]
MRLGIVAGEASGDQLAAGLIHALRARVPDLQVQAVAGPRMQEAGCDVLAQAEELAVMGLAEVLPEVSRLWKLRRRLRAHWLEHRPDVFVGVDAPDFTLGLERALKAEGIPTVHYVSPTVWAWRAGRVHGIANAADALLCLFPFEPDCYRETSLQAHFVGHPFAQAMARQPEPAQARAKLGLPAQGPLLALVPGSRRGEVAQLGPLFFQTARLLQARLPELHCVLPAANAERRSELEALRAEHAPELPLTLLDGQMRLALRAADLAVVTSGTATLETLLAGTPMLVAYRTGAFTNFLMRDLGLLRTRHVSLPNILAGRGLVPEFLQEQAEPLALSRAAWLLLTHAGAREAQQQAFAQLREAIHRDTDALAADAVLRTCGRA